MLMGLSLRRPWPDLVLGVGGRPRKEIENRPWRTTKLGWIALHVAKGCTRGEHERCHDWLDDAGFTEEEQPALRPLDEMPAGGVVGLMRFDAHVPLNADTAAAKAKHPGVDFRWRMAGQHAYIIGAVVTLARLYPCDGAQRFFIIPPDVTQLIVRDPGLMASEHRGDIFLSVAA